MKPISILRYIRRVNEAHRHWALNSVRLPYNPYQVTVEATNYCNLRCPKCLHGHDNYPRSLGFMPYELFEKIIKENSNHLLYIYLMFGGESLLHPDLPAMIRLAKKYGLWQTFLHTNGTLLTEELSHRLIEVGLDNLVFSFDGDSKETYEKPQVGASYEKTMTNIQNFLKIKKKLNSSKPFASIKIIRSFVDQSASISADFTRKFDDLPLNRIYFDKLFAQGEYGEKLLENKQWNVFNRDKILRKDMDRYFPCYNVYSEVVVTWEGKIIRCCRDQEGYFEMGDLSEETITDVWNNEAFLSVRENLKKKILDGPCRLCSSVWCGPAPSYHLRNFLEYITAPKYLIRFYFPELGRKLFAVRAINKLFSTST